MGAVGNLAAFIVFAGFSGLGLGIAWAYTNVVTQSLVPPQEAGAASGTVLTSLVSVGGVALAIAVSIYRSHTTSGSPNEATIIDMILVGVGILTVVTALAVVVFGREAKKVPAKPR
jgi:hypothetical protein